MLGFLKSVAIAPAELEGAFEEGIGFDGSSIEGFARVSESDTVANPDPSTFQVLPWTTGSGHHHSARIFCDITMPDGSPSWADPRHVLRRQLTKANELGFSCYVHPEIEFFLLKPGPEDGTEPVPIDNAGYFDQAVHESASSSAGMRSRRWSSWASRWSSVTTRARPASRRSICASPTRCRWPTT
ncbi:hypothetical protein NIIDMKKI_27220 [Mycobacterium kansasii]|uniref:glutamine synthetase n=1 Tax=Mycobacterium kansasii TaxID=1768 RepID=A0A7G1I985_MYCKA|nr:hypothetical protein NIIDMKKI_27220 [Mycobacterium kansasii]